MIITVLERKISMKNALTHLLMNLSAMDYHKFYLVLVLLSLAMFIMGAGAPGTGSGPGLLNAAYAALP